MSELIVALERLGLRAATVDSLAGDASARRFFRVRLVGGGTVVACLYSEGGDGQAARDAAVQRWGVSRGLPVPRLLGHAGRVTASQDLGDTDLELALGGSREEVEVRVLETLAAFQGCPMVGLPTPPFDAEFWRRELVMFEWFAVPPGHPDAPVVGAFLDDLAERLATHPYRLVHRDFHVNNLFLHEGRVWAVDFQDMRGGPDTYDAASLLRERAGARLFPAPTRWLEGAAARLEWTDGWRRRYLECAAQRGMKVIGTFLRLAAEGRSSYLAFVGDVVTGAEQALQELSAPQEVIAALGRATASPGV